MNHHSNILKQLPKSITKSLSEPLPSEEILNSSNRIYSKALKEIGFTDDLKYSLNEARQLEKNEERKLKER